MKVSVSLKSGLVLILSILLLSESAFSQKLYPFSAYVSGNQLWGYQDQNGKVVVKPKYYKAEEFVDGLSRITLLDENVEWRYGFVDVSGKEIIPLIYSQVKLFSEGLVAVSQKDKWGFLDKTGKKVIPITYDEVNDYGFQEGLVAVKIGSKWGFLDKMGKTIIPFAFEDAKYFANGLAPVKTNGYWGYIERSGRTMIAASFNNANPFIGKLTGVENSSEKWAVIDITGKLLTTFKYDAVGTTTNDLSLIVASNYDPKIYRHFYGVIDDHGKEVVDLKYRTVDILRNELIRVEDFEQNHGLVNRKGKQVLPLKYEGVYAVDKGTLGYFYEKNGDKRAFIMKEDKIDILKYQTAGDAVNERMSVMLNNKWGIIDFNGNEIVAPKYDTVTSFQAPMALVMKDKKLGAIDRDGKEKIEAKYDYLRDGGESTIMAVLIDKVGFLDKDGKVLVPFKYQDADMFVDGIAAVVLNNKVGFVDFKGVEIIPCQFDKMESRFENGKAQVVKAGKAIIIDKSGKEVK